ncbi:MAG: PilZ domain-containing protein [Syntrophobacterales bacterium]
MESFERRKYTRTLRSFRIKIKLARTSKEVDGVTQDLSQGGAFISSPSWPTFHQNDQAEMRVYLPPEFTGQNNTLVLTGPALVKRIEKERQGVAVEFLRELRTFQPSL